MPTKIWIDFAIRALGTIPNMPAKRSTSARSYTSAPASVQLSKMRAALAKAKAASAAPRGGYRASGHGDYKIATSRGGVQVTKRGPATQRQRLGYPEKGSRFAERSYRSPGIGRFKGSGDYAGDWGKQLSGWGSAIGKGAGTIADIGSSIGKFFGFGDYKVHHNSLLTGNTPPRMETHLRSNIFTHREFLGDVKSSVDFAISQFPLNPGMAVTFPWLHDLADNYEQYRIVGMIFEYQSVYSDAVVSSSTTGALGNVIMATEYDSTREAFGTESDMQNHQYTTAAKPSENFLHPIECSVNENPLTVLYVRDSDVLASQDPRMMDLGQFYIATVGMPAADEICGKLWVTYQVELLKPRLQEQTDDRDELSCHYRLPAATIAGAAPFGTTAAASYDSLNGLTPEVGSTLVVTNGGATQGGAAVNRGITFPADIHSGHFLCTYQVTGAATTLTNAIVPSYVYNCSALALLNAGTSSFWNADAGATLMTRQFCVWLMQVTGPNAQMLMGSSTAFTPPGTITGGDLIITQVNVGIITKPRKPPGCFDTFEFKRPKGPPKSAMAPARKQRTLPQPVEEQPAEEEGDKLPLPSEDPELDEEEEAAIKEALAKLAARKLKSHFEIKEFKESSKVSEPPTPGKVASKK